MQTFTFRYSPNEPSIGKKMRDAVHGKPHVRPNELISTELKDLLRIASESRLSLFAAILEKKPNSIYELAEMLNKSQPYVLKEVRVLESLGLIKLHRESESGRERLRPEALYSNIVIDCGFSSSREAS